MLNFVIGILGNLFAAELGTWCRHLAGQLIVRAAKKLPDSLRERMREEWSALLDDTPGDVSKIAVAISLYWKRSKIADQCEDTAESSIPSALLDTLTDTESAVLEMTAQGMTVGEISIFLYHSRTSVEYYKIRCAEKLSGQPNIGRKDVISFFAAGHKYSQSTFRKLISRFRRASRWRRLRLQSGQMHHEG